MTSPDSQAVVERIVDSGVVAVMRGADAESIAETTRALGEGGVTAIEITVDNPDAMAMLSELSETFSADEAVVGAGTVLEGSTAHDAIAHGAEYVVSPTFDPDVVDAANRYGVPVAPGVFTPTEALDAYEAGADFVKIFPASSVGPGHIESIHGPLPQIPIMPTGGVDLDNVADFIRAGALVVGAGSALVDGDAVAAGDYDEITRRAQAFTDAIDAAREE